MCSKAKRLDDKLKEERAANEAKSQFNYSGIPQSLYRKQELDANHLIQ